jgi:ABC-type sugar transport system substrate-binding protein
MTQLSVVVSLSTDASDFQREQAKSAKDAAARLDMAAQVIYAQDDALTQSEQLLGIIQGDRGHRPQAIVMQPCGQTALPHVARAAAAAGIAWVVLNWTVDYLSELREKYGVPAFVISSDQQEIGRIQGRQVAAILPQGGSVLHVTGPTNSPSTRLRSQGWLETKPANIQVRALKSEGWTQQDGARSVGAWLRLATARHARFDAVVAQSDMLALGARSALQASRANGRPDSNSQLPFSGVDGLPLGGQAWVQQGILAATVVVPTNAGAALEMLSQSIRSGVPPAEVTYTTPTSYPALADLAQKTKRADAP